MLAEAALGPVVNNVPTVVAKVYWVSALFVMVGGGTSIAFSFGRNLRLVVQNKPPFLRVTLRYMVVKAPSLGLTDW